MPGPFDAAVTSAFIVHLPSEAKRRLYVEVFRVLSPGGSFFNVDQVRPANEEMEAWYRERRERHQDALILHHQIETEETHRLHRLHHHLETEADQLAVLRAAGFVRIDCYYKRLLQTVIGGYKPR